jgi:hypothetical protein
MWAQYTARGSGIAIRSTYARLVHALRNWPTPTHIGLVQYIDYDDDSSVIGGNNLLAPFIHKRAEFSGERELRALISQTPSAQQGGLTVVDHSVSMAPGTLAPIDVHELVERVIVSPQTPDWQLDALKALIDKCDCSVPVERSRLDRPAVLG